MIRSLFRNAARISARFKFAPTVRLLRIPTFLFADNISKSILDKMLRDKDASLDNYLLQIQQLSEDSKQDTLKLIIRYVDMNKLTSHVLRHPRFIQLADRYPQVALQTLMREMASTEQQLIAQRAKEEPDYERVQGHLQKFSDGFQIWGSKLQELKQPMKIFHYLVELNRTQNYLFQSYIAPFIPRQSREATFADLYQWNISIANEMKPNIEKIQHQLSHLQAHQPKQQRLQLQILHRKHYLLSVLDSFAYNLLHSNVLCEKIHQLNQDTIQLRKQQLNIESSIDFVLPFYQFIGYHDINLFSTRTIELTRLKTYLGLMNEKHYGNLQKPQSEDYKHAQDIVKNQIESMIWGLMNQYRQIKNKASNLNKLSNIAITLMGIRLEHTRRKDLHKNQQEEVAEAKQQILKQIDDANARKIVEQNLSAFIETQSK